MSEKCGIVGVGSAVRRAIDCGTDAYEAHCCSFDCPAGYRATAARRGHQREESCSTASNGTAAPTSWKIYCVPYVSLG